MSEFSYALRKLRHSKIFQGEGKRKNYFEGWYFKLVADKGEWVTALIPGVAYGPNGEDPHAFVQRIDGKTGQTHYHRFEIGDFSYRKDRFEVQIGENVFTEHEIRLAIPGDVEGVLQFSGLSYFPSRPLAPGIMGWYRFAPFLECYHGVVSLDHRIDGELMLAGQNADFSGGRGYTEKDWGRSFPEAWIWMQTNHFDAPKTSFMLSVALIPWIRQTFTGFLGFLLHEGRVYRFATYTGAKIRSIRHSEKQVEIVIDAGKHRLEVWAEREHVGILAAPDQGNMDRRISESLDARIRVRLSERRGEKTIFEGTGHHAGLELAGEVDLLLEKLR